MTIIRAGSKSDHHNADDGKPDAVELTDRFVHEAMPFADELTHRARALTRNYADAEDLMQETMLRAFNGYANFQSGSNIRAWLYRIQINAWIAKYRIRRRRPEEWSTDELTDAQMFREARHGASSTWSAESAALGHVVEHEVAEAWRCLDYRQRAVIFLADIEGLAYKEIATLTGIPIGTVMSRIHRGRKALRRQLEDYGRHRGYLRGIATTESPTTSDTALGSRYAG